jgi:hypothetical protein
VADVRWFSEQPVAQQKHFKAHCKELHVSDRVMKQTLTIGLVMIVGALVVTLHQMMNSKFEFTFHRGDSVSLDTGPNPCNRWSSHSLESRPDPSLDASNASLRNPTCRPFPEAPTSSIVPWDHANFANVMASKFNAQNELESLLDFCPQPNGCSASGWSITVVVPCFKRISRFEEITSAIAASSARIDRIIFTLNGSPEQSAFMTKIDAFKANPDVLAKNIKVDTLSSSLEIGFYFRFQAALLLDTQFVAFIDDDQHVGPSFLLDCLKLLHIKKTLGVCGVRGATYKTGSAEWRSTLGRTTESQYVIMRSIESDSSMLDSLFSAFVMPASWVKLIFRERFWSIKTGEDLTIPYLLRKYAGVPAHAINPSGYQAEIYNSDLRSWNDLPYVSDVHDSKRDGFVQESASRQDNYLRARILEQHRSRGEFFRWAAYEKLNKTLIVIGNQRQAHYVVKHMPHVLESQNTGLNSTCQKGVRFSMCSKNVIHSGFAIAVVADNSMDDGATSVEDEIFSILGIDMNDIENYYSNAIHRFLNGWDFVRAPSFEFTFSDILLNFGAVLRGTSPSEVIIINDGGPESAAAALTCRLGNVGHISVVETGEAHASFFQTFTGAMRRG